MPDGNGDPARFSLANNTIAYANRDALLTRLPLDAVVADVGQNVFERECSCEVSTWLDFVCGGAQGQDLLSLGEAVKNSSLCRVEKSFRRCFGGEDTALIPAYVGRLCKDGAEDPQLECSSGVLDHLWEAVRDQIEVETNKGILLILLLCAILFSLIMSIYTLLRWIVYTLQVRAKTRNSEEEWNFTKIEERQLHTPTTPIDHYESLALAKPEEILEEEEEEESEEVSSENKEDQTTSELMDTSTASDRASLVVGEDKRASVANRDSMPKMTFYDEMIDLLKEKLDDPDNYGTVADSSSSTKGPNAAAAAAASTALYQDPFEVQTKPEDKK